MRVLAQVAGGLEAAAATGLVHHDLSAGAIVMDEAEPANAVLTDFGISLPGTPGCELLRATESVEYRSPEQVRGEPPQPASNVYSLSCILTECLTGAPPFRYDRPLLTLHAHVVEPAPQISRRRDDLTPDIDRVIANGMAKDPHERFASPMHLIRAAAPALGVKTPVAAIPPPRKHEPRRPRPARRSKRRLGRGGLVPASGWVALALLVSALAGFATGNLELSPEHAAPAPVAAARAAAAAEHRAVREQRTEYVDAVGRTMDRLDQRRAAALRDLRRARRPLNQAASARTLAGAFAHARNSLPPPAPALSGGPLSRSLRGAERAYRALAVAARKRSFSRWKTARREALEQETKVEHALAGLRSRYNELERRSAGSTRA